MVLVANLVNTQGEFILAESIKAHAELFPASERAAIIGRFYGAFYSVVNAAALIVQALLVARILKSGGTRLALFLLPAVAMCGYGAIAMLPSLAVVAMAKAAENSVDYSMQTTVRRRCSCPRIARSNTRGRRRSTRSACASATWRRVVWCWSACTSSRCRGGASRSATWFWSGSGWRSRSRSRAGTGACW